MGGEGVRWPAGCEVHTLAPTHILTHAHTCWLTHPLTHSSLTNHPNHPNTNHQPTTSPARHQLSLYAHISKVAWRLEQEEAFVGSVSDTKTGEIRTFAIDPSHTSHFQAVNQLWELL